MFLLLAVGIVVPYFSLQRWRPFPPRAPFESALDALDPVPAGLGAGLPVGVSAGAALPAARREARGRLALPARHRGALPAVLRVLPARSRCPGRGPRRRRSGGAYGWLVGVDATWNAFPSLHAGLVLFSFLYGWRAVGADLGPRGRRLFGAAFGALGRADPLRDARDEAALARGPAARVRACASRRLVRLAQLAVGAPARALSSAPARRAAIEPGSAQLCRFCRRPRLARGLNCRMGRDHPYPQTSRAG